MGRYTVKFGYGDIVALKPEAKYAYVRSGVEYRVTAVSGTGSISLDGVRGFYNPENFYYIGNTSKQEDSRKSDEVKCCNDVESKEETGIFMAIEITKSSYNEAKRNDFILDLTSSDIHNIYFRTSIDALKQAIVDDSDNYVDSDNCVWIILKQREVGSIEYSFVAHTNGEQL